MAKAATQSKRHPARAVAAAPAEAALVFPAWLQRIHRFRGYIAPVGFILMMAVLLVPLPPLLMDVLICLNISLSMVILLTTIYMNHPLDFSVFPSLLLATTLFRLVLNVASIEALRAAPMFSVYAACKAGMVNFTRSLALELADHGIRVNAIAPDIVDTPHLQAFEGSATGGSREARERGIPLRRAGTVEDCANACIFLASEMASYVTGVTLSVDGGTFASSGWTRNPDGSWGLFH